MKFDAEIDLKNTDKHITKMRVKIVLLFINSKIYIKIS